MKMKKVQLSKEAIERKIEHLESMTLQRDNILVNLPIIEKQFVEKLPAKDLDEKIETTKMQLDILQRQKDLDIIMRNEKVKIKQTKEQLINLEQNIKVLTRQINTKTESIPEGAQQGGVI